MLMTTANPSNFMTLVALTHVQTQQCRSPAHRGRPSCPPPRAIANQLRRPLFSFHSFATSGLIRLACVLDAAAQPARKAVCASRLERPPGWFGRLVAGGSEDKAAYECAWDVETKHPSARNKPEALQFRYDAGIYCMHGTRYSIFHCG